MVDLLQVFVFLILTNLTYMESLCIHHDGWGYYSVVKYNTFVSTKFLKKMSFSPHTIPKTKGLEESLGHGDGEGKTLILHL